MKYQVYWIDKLNKIEKAHGKYATLEEAKQSVRDWWKLNGYEPFYIRQWKAPGKHYTWDYGSHIYFYEFREVGVNDD